MKKLTYISIFIISLMLSFSLVNAQTMEDMMGDTEVHQDGHQNLDEVLPSLLDKYEVGSIEDLECDEVSEEDLEVLGDAVMETMHPGETHELMDQRMGGEGSESLRSMHIHMGENYIGCGDSWGMMGGEMGSMMMGRNNMMRGFEDHDFYQKTGENKLDTALSGILTLSALMFFTSGTYFFLKKAKIINKKKGGGNK